MPENRKHLRLPVASRTFIELVSPLLGNTHGARIVSCTTLDVSQRGLSVSLAEAVTVDAILQIGIDFPDESETLYLAGQVRWCRSFDDAEHPWTAGFELLNSKGSDIERWTALLSKMEG